MSLLDGRVVIVTGAGRGIGREHARLMAQLGAHVVVNDAGVALDGSGHDRGPAEEVVAEIVADGGVAVANTEPVNDWEGARRLVESAVTTFGDLHAVVNNAGILRDRMLVNMTEDEFDRVISVHLKGSFGVTRWAATYFREQHAVAPGTDRAVVYTSSAVGLEGNPGQTNMAAAKAGIASMTIVHSRELARYGVRVNCVAPIARTRGTEQTPGLGATVATADRADDPFDPAHVAPLVAALVSPGLDLTGQVFSVVGGAIGRYDGWSIGDEISPRERWTAGDLATALGALPPPIPRRGQLDVVAELLSAPEAQEVAR